MRERVTSPSPTSQKRRFQVFHLAMAKAEREGLSLAGDDGRASDKMAGIQQGLKEQGCLVGSEVR